MALVYSGTFQPDSQAIMSIASYGIPIWFQVQDDNGNPVNLTNVTSIELEFTNLTVASNVITKTCVKNDAINGLGYMVTTPNMFTTKGQYATKTILNYAASSDFPDGKKIKAYRTSPESVEIVD